MAKTTGSKPVLILPDGSEYEIARPGGASIREQVRVVKAAAGAGAEALVAEMMSIGAECLSVESGDILRPRILALTNVRPDHIDAMGRRREDIAGTLTAAFPRKGTVFVPAEEVYPAFEEAAARRGCRLEPVPRETDGASGGGGRTGSGDRPALGFEEFEPNIRLALAVLRGLGVGREEALRGMSRARPDFGSLRVWRVEAGRPPRTAACVNAFAANDPESSADVLRLVRKRIPAEGRSFAAVLSLRDDRGDRTIQWIEAAGEGFFRGFELVAVLGSPALAAARRLRKALGHAVRVVVPPAGEEAPRLMDALAGAASGELVVVGLGNIVGPGGRLVSHWQEAGRPW